MDGDDACLLIGAAQHCKGSSHYEHTYSISEMPERVRLLAEEITEGHTAPYAKAMAIEQHLKTNYTYRFADPLTGGIPLVLQRRFIRHGHS